MSMTKAAIIAAARERADAYRSSRWDDTDLGVMLGAIHWREWADILNANNMYRVHTFSVTPDSNGQVAKSSLQDSTRTFYRILSIKDVDRFFTPIQYKDAPRPAQFGYAQAYSWYEFGETIQLVPIVQGSVDFTVNYRPPRANTLSNSDIVDFPDGHEYVLVYALAAEMLLKGGAETDAANDLIAFQRSLKEQMLADIRRLSVRPTLMEPMDDAADWGSW